MVLVEIPRSSGVTNQTTEVAAGQNEIQMIGGIVLFNQPKLPIQAGGLPLHKGNLFFGKRPQRLEAMSGSRYPKFKNDHGIPEICIGVKEFNCIGASPPQDHPHVYINMRETDTILCPLLRDALPLRSSIVFGRG